jgi:MYXO-CTERM domain-containing protein
MSKKAWLGAALIAGLGLASGSSNAVVISSGANSHAFSWNFWTGSYFLTGNGSLTVVDGFNSNQLTVEFTLNNTSPNPGQGGDRLVAFGFGIDPNATGVSFQDAADGGMRYANFAPNGALVSNVPGVEICAWSGPNCNGNASNGIYAGTGDTFRILLAGTWGSEVNVDPIGLRYQTGNGSFTFRVPPPSNVPAPGPLALFLLGLAGVAAHRRRAADPVMA